jgi:ubiquinone/menaquinone biosynthesis C-methylase UbiE
VHAMDMAEQSPPSLDSAVKAYYDRAPEESRLDQGYSQLERYRTRELILRHAVRPPAVVLDIGGAAGAYTFWLAELGYEVHLVDAVPRLIQVARDRNKAAAGQVASCTVGDARALAREDGSANMVLLLGPLYHLVDAPDRRAALREAARVLAPGGLLLAAGISRWASALDGLSRELLRDERFARIVERDLDDGHHHNPTDRLDYFTTAYFHRPDELRREVMDAGFAIEGFYGIEGPGWILPDLVERWQDPGRREMILKVARALESESSVLGTSAHLLVVGRREQ